MCRVIKQFLLKALCLGALCGVVPTSSLRAETDFGQVSMYVAQMLQQHHYEQKAFDDTVSERLLENYLNFLDFTHLYFTQKDVDKFRQLYASTLDDRVLLRDITPAIEIYRAYAERVKERYTMLEKTISEESFDFTGNSVIHRSRKDEPWPANKEEADKVWKDIIENNLLEEHLSSLAKKEAETKRLKKAKETELNAYTAGAQAPNAPETEAIVDAENTTDDESSKGAEKENKPDKDDKELSPGAQILKRYEQVLKDLDDTDEEEIANFFLSSLAEAYDPHSDYFSQSELENFEIGMKNELIGIGALLSKDDEGAAEIQGLVVGGPADKANELKPFDRIIAVGQGLEGEMVDITFMKLQKVVEMIRGKEGTTVRLKINPADADDPSFSTEILITRETVKLKDKLANGELIEFPRSIETPDNKRRIGWINLSSFYADMEGGTTSTTTDIRKIVERLKKEGVEGMVLDLRNNPGGSLEEAINLTGLFIERGPVVQQKDWIGDTSFRSSRANKPVYDGPLVVLIDRSSASASEILAAALQDYQRAVIVGESSSFGKGTVQTVMPVNRYMPFFSDRERAGALKVTIQKFYRIAGGSTQLRGVVPDIIFPSIRDALDIGEDALDHPLAYDEIKPLDFAPSASAPLPISEIHARFESRIAGNREFQHIIADRDRLKKRIDENSTSLNLANRLNERNKNKERREARKKERQERNRALEAEGKADLYQIYKLTQDIVDLPGLVSASEFSEEDSTGMRMGKNEEDEEDEDTGFPYGMEPQKLEALNILQDLIDLSAHDRTAKASNHSNQGG